MALKPPVEVPQGAIRLNTESQKLEFFAQDQWWEMATDVPTLDGGARGIFAGGYTGGPATVYNTIEYITIPSAGNATDFGDLTAARSAPGGTASSRTRGLVFGGYIAPNDTDAIDYITISSTGNGVDFGNMLGADRYGNAGSNQTRAVQMGGYSGGSQTNVMQYVTIATTGNTVDFGDLLTSSGIQLNTCTSPTISVLGGFTGPSNTIEYITIHTLGNAQDFGDLPVKTNQNCASNVSSSTRGVFFPGGPSSIDSISYITMASKGNAIEYGDTNGMAGGSGRMNCASTIRAVTAGGGSGPAYSNQIGYIAIATGGTAVDFGDTTQARTVGSGLSNGHGGL